MEAIQFTEEQRRWAETSLQLGTIAKSLSGKQEEATNNNFIGESLIKNGYFDQTIPGSKSPILGNELVQNGNFEEKGAEIVVDGDFPLGTTAWEESSESDVTFGNGFVDIYKAPPSSGAYIYQDILENNKTYQVTFSGVITEGVLFLGSNGVNTQFTAGTYVNETFSFSPLNIGVNPNIFLIRNPNTGTTIDARITSVSIKQLDPNDRWTLGGGWSYGDSEVLRIPQIGSTSCTQSINFEASKLYLIEYTIKVNAGQIKIRLGGGGGTSETTSRSSSGTYKEEIFASNNHTEFNLRAVDGAFDGSVLNVSVKEIEAVDVDLWETVTNSLDSTIVFSEGFVTLDYDGGDGTLFIRQSDILTINDNYTVVIDYQMISGQGRVWVGTNYTDLTSTTRETKTFNAQALINDDFIIARKTNGQAMKMVVYSVAVYKIDNSDWTLQGNWSIVRGQGLKGAGVSGDFAFQSGTPAVATKTYRIEYKISSYTAGGVRVRFGNTFTDIVSSAGTFVQSIVASNTAYLEIISQEVGGSKFDGVIEYIKVQRGEQSDTLDMTDPSPKALWVVAPGNLKVTTMAGDVTTINGLEADTFIDWLRIKKVWLTGTTVSDIIGIY